MFGRRAQRGPATSWDSLTWYGLDITWPYVIWLKMLDSQKSISLASSPGVTLFKWQNTHRADGWKSTLVELSFDTRAYCNSRDRRQYSISPSLLFIYHGSTSPPVLPVHRPYQSNGTTSPPVLPVHRCYQSTGTTNPPVLPVHRYYQSTGTTSPPVLPVHRYYQYSLADCLILDVCTL